MLQKLGGISFSTNQSICWRLHPRPIRMHLGSHINVASYGKLRGKHLTEYRLSWQWLSSFHRFNSFGFKFSQFRNVLQLQFSSDFLLKRNLFVNDTKIGAFYGNAFDLLPSLPRKVDNFSKFLQPWLRNKYCFDLLDQNIKWCVPWAGTISCLTMRSSESLSSARFKTKM